MKIGNARFAKLIWSVIFPNLFIILPVGILVMV